MTEAEKLAIPFAHLGRELTMWDDETLCRLERQGSPIGNWFKIGTFKDAARALDGE